LNNSRLETGSCFCGNIAAKFTGEPFFTCYDYDDDCRRAIGSPLTIWVGYRPDQFKLLRGSPTRYSKTTGVTRCFCAMCGTSIGYVDEGLPDEFYVSIGFFDLPERFPPQAHAYWQMKLPWIEFADNLPRIDGYSRKRDKSKGNPIDRVSSSGGVTALQGR
jgi:hypothetical protein